MPASIRKELSKDVTPAAAFHPASRRDNFFLLSTRQLRFQVPNMWDEDGTDANTATHNNNNELLTSSLRGLCGITNQAKQSNLGKMND